MDFMTQVIAIVYVCLRAIGFNVVIPLFALSEALQNIPMFDTAEIMQSIQLFDIGQILQSISCIA